MTQPGSPDAFTPIEIAMAKFRDEIAGLTTERDYWKSAAESAAAETAWAESRLATATEDGAMFPPIVAPGVPFRDLVLPTGRRIRFTANFAVITVVLQFAAEEGIAADALANIDIADVRLIPTMLRPDRAEEILARGGMALQPDENWRMVLAQLDTDSFTELVGWLLTAAVVGLNELAATGEDDGQGEAPEPSAA